MNKKSFLTLSFFITLIGFGFQNTQAMDETEGAQPQTQPLNKRLQELRDELISERESQIKSQERLNQLKAQCNGNDERLSTVESQQKQLDELKEINSQRLETLDQHIQQADELQREMAEKEAEIEAAAAQNEAVLEQLRQQISQKEEKSISSIVKRKIPQNLEISGDDLGLKAVHKIIDQETRESILKIYNASYANAKLLIDWLIFEVSNPEEMLNYWKDLPFEKRPIIQIPDSWKAEQEVTKIEDLENGLKNDWQGQPLIISGDHHVVAITGQKNVEEKKFTVSFYDAYEPFGKESSSYLEMAILFNFLHRHFPTYEVNVIPYYTKHQKLTTFGECRLFADVYYNCLSKGEKPEYLSEEVVLQEVEEMKIKMRQDDPEYFHKYDTLFQYIFDSGYAQILSNDIMDHKKILTS